MVLRPPESRCEQRRSSRTRWRAAHRDRGDGCAYAGLITGYQVISDASPRSLSSAIWQAYDQAAAPMRFRWDNQPPGGRLSERPNRGAAVLASRMPGDG